jgi:tetratricopeptide (TPR) repeat protein
MAKRFIMWISQTNQSGIRKMLTIAPIWPIGLLGIGLLSSDVMPVLAKPQPDAFPPNPLELPIGTPPQPPMSNNDRMIRDRQLTELNQQALAQLQGGNDKAAFDLWNQQLRLSRSLGPIGETKALAQVGTIAWEKNNTQQVRYISQRLQQIQTTAVKDQDADLLAELAAAYQVIRAPQLAVSTYGNLLQAARQKADPLGEFKSLNAIGQTHLNWFGYQRAAQVYQELLDQAKSQQDTPNQLAYLYQLAYIHEQAKNFPAAAVALQDLIPLYREAIGRNLLSTVSSPTVLNPIVPSPQSATTSTSTVAATTAQPNVLAFLEIRLGDSYAASQQAGRAEVAYQAAYKTAQAQVQLGYAGDALRKLGKFYRSQNRFDAALQVYDFLTSFEQDETQNLYNTLDAFDQIGQIYLQKQDKPKAIAAFQRGLQTAQALSYRTEYFTQQINQIGAPKL